MGRGKATMDAPAVAVRRRGGTAPAAPDSSALVHRLQQQRTELDATKRELTWYRGRMAELHRAAVAAQARGTAVDPASVAAMTQPPVPGQQF